MERGYDRNIVRTQIQSAKEISRNTAPIPKKQDNQKRIPFLVSYHPGLPNSGKILRDLHQVFRSSGRCRDIVKELPVMAFRRPKNLKDYLVRVRLNNGESVNDRGTARCDNGRCQICRNHIHH